MYDNYDRGTRRTVLKLYRATPDPGETGVQVGAALAPLKKPALVVWGAKDPYVNVRYAERQREFFDVQDVVILPDSGHWPFKDDPRARRAGRAAVPRRAAAERRPPGAAAGRPAASRIGPRRAGAAAHARPGRLCAVTKRSTPSITTTGSRESLARASSAVAAAASAIASQVACSSRPAASRRPRQSSSGDMPAQPIATSHCPWRHARPKLSVISTATLLAGELAQARADAPRRGVGVARKQHQRARLGGV